MTCDLDNFYLMRFHSMTKPTTRQRMTAISIQGFLPSTTKNLLEPSKSGLNSWSNKRTIKIPVLDFFFNFRDVQWKGKTITVEYELFTLMVKQWVADGMTKEQALDLMFDMSL